jgi:hypothetical protein
MICKVKKTVEVFIPDGLTIRQLMPHVEMHTYSGVKRWCLRNGYKFAMEFGPKNVKYKELMDKVSPGLTRRELAEYLGVSMATASNCAREYGYQCKRDHKGWMKSEDWNKVIWEKPDSLIARETSLSSERVRQMRVRLGKPPSPYHRMELAPDFVEYKWGKGRVA